MKELEQLIDETRSNLIENKTLLANLESRYLDLKIDKTKVMFCPNCGCGNPKKTYDGYWCKMCKTEI